MSDERVAALRYFLDLDNPYLGVDQQRIMEGIAALKSLESQNQALQEALQGVLWHIAWARGEEPFETAFQLLSPTQETDPE